MKIESEIPELGKVVVYSDMKVSKMCEFTIRSLSFIQLLCLKLSDKPVLKTVVKRVKQCVTDIKNDISKNSNNEIKFINMFDL